MAPVDGGSLAAGERLQALRAAGLLGGPPHDAFVRLARLAGRLLATPAAMVALAAGGRQFIKGAVGVPEPRLGRHPRPLARSFCKHVVAAGAPLAIADARDHPLTRDDPALRGLEAVAYLGVPLRGPDDLVLGTLCVVDGSPRAWTEADIETLSDLAHAVQGEIRARLYRRQHERSEAARRAGEARSDEILERIDEAFYAIDREWRLVYVNRHTERLWGRRRAELLGRSLLEIFPAFAGSKSHRAHQRAMAKNRPVRIETVSAIFGAAVEINVFPSPSGLSVYFRDISDRQRLEQALRERDETLTLAERSAEIGVWDVDLATGMVRATPQFFRLLGLEPAPGPLPIEALRAFRHPEDRERVLRGFDEAVASGANHYEMEYRIVRPDGELRWIFGRGRVVRDGRGEPVRYSGIDIDITERKRLEEHQRLLVAELSHRVKNTLATIQSIATQSLSDGRPLAEAREAFLRRLHALARTHSLLTENEWRGAKLSTLVQDELSPYGECASLEGPDLMLTPKATLTLGLIVHELATNAAKHGALAAARGRIEVAWGVDGAGGFSLAWRERGGAAVRPPARRGFGWTLLEQAVAYDLQGRSSLRFPREGLRYELTAPCDEVVAQG